LENEFGFSSFGFKNNSDNWNIGKTKSSLPLKSKTKSTIGLNILPSIPEEEDGIKQSR
jgi:hypothetical protein